MKSGGILLRTDGWILRGDKKMAKFREISASSALMLYVLPQASIAAPRCLDTQYMINICNQLSWRVIANNTIVDAEEGSWITDEYYSESIRNVIGKAIADCVTGKNEFAGKDAGETITFAANPTTYTDENWNAVVLWNFIHEYMCEHVKNGIEDSTNPKAKGYYNAHKIIDKVYTQTFDKLYAKLLFHYKTYSIDDLQGKLKKAITDIKAYSEALNLKYRLPWFFKTANHLKSHNKICQTDKIAPGVKVWFIEYEEERMTNICVGPVYSLYIDIKLAGVKYTIPYSIEYRKWGKSTVVFFPVNCLKQGSDIYHGEDAAEKVSDELFYELFHEAASILFKGMKGEIKPEAMTALTMKGGYCWNETLP